MTAQRSAGWRNRDILRAALLIAGVYITLRLLWFANAVFLVTFLAVLFGLALSAGVDQLERLKVRRGLGAFTIVLALLGALFGMGALMAPTLREQAVELRQRLPEAVEQVDNWFTERRQGLLGLVVGDSADTLTVGRTGAETGSQARPRADTAAAQGEDTVPAPEVPLRQRIAEGLGGLTGYLFPFLSSTLAVIGGLLLIIFIAIYIAVEPDLYRRGIMHLFPQRSRERAGEVLSAMALMLRKWLVTQLIAMVVIGAVTSIILMILNVRAALALGLIAGLLEFVPIFGPIISAVPAIAMGFLDSPEKALYVLIAYIIIQQLESQLLIPMIMKEGMDLPPVLTILSQAIMSLLFGFLGLMVAVPVLAAVLVPVKMLYVEAVIGDEVTVPGEEAT
ncbi:MAG TPA: AI-2E family transporter [Gemmatimonadaceae bacterium]|nr:AI-2E family transporter [Gemmatimonadaceae bacterium]